MNMQVNPNGKLQPETPPKAEEARHPEQAASAGTTISSAKAALEAQAGQIAGASETGKTTAASARRPSCDQYIPQKPGDAASYGHYQPVSDGEGNTRIQFAAPPQEPAAGQGGGSPEAAAGKQAARDRYVPEKQSKWKAAEATGGKQNTQTLEMRKKRLEQQVRSTGDSEERKTLKQKLEQVKRALKAAGKK